MSIESTTDRAAQEPEAAAYPGTRQTSNLRCLVVGAASGIGQATAERLSGNGNRVVGADLPSAHWPGQDSKQPQLSIDIADPHSVRDAVDQAAALLGGLDVVVNTEGILGKGQPSSEETFEEFVRLVSINLTGAFALSWPRTASAGSFISPPLRARKASRG